MRSGGVLCGPVLVALVMAWELSGECFRSLHLLSILLEQSCRENLWETLHGVSGKYVSESDWEDLLPPT